MSEKVINGVLCFSKDSDLQGAETEWVSYTSESMTTAFISMRAMFESAELRAIRAERALNSISENVKDYFGKLF